MSKQYLNPPGLLDGSKHGFNQVVTSRGGTTVRIAGQCAIDAKFNVIGAGDFKTQFKVALENLRLALDGVGASLSDLVTTRYYIVDFKQEFYDQLSDIEDAFFGDIKRPAGTLISVQALVMPELMLEIEATAVIDD